MYAYLRTITGLIAIGSLGLSMTLFLTSIGFWKMPEEKQEIAVPFTMGAFFYFFSLLQFAILLRPRNRLAIAMRAAITSMLLACGWFVLFDVWVWPNFSKSMNNIELLALNLIVLLLGISEVAVWWTWWFDHRNSIKRRVTRKT